jgi:hypothetical protein
MEDSSLLNGDDQKNYQQFFDDAISTGCVWGLQGDDGWAQCDSEKYESTTVIPFWSQPEFVEAHQADEWKHYEIVAVSLEEFLDDWLTGMHTDVLLVGINWDAQLNGLDYEPLDVLHDFETALSS